MNHFFFERSNHVNEENVSDFDYNILSEIISIINHKIFFSKMKKL